MLSKQEAKDLLTKNKKRLQQELTESREAVFLIKKSMTESLSGEEKDKIKEQLLDICKSVPALTVFMLPGGTLLFPLLIKWIPDILPSAFREENDEEE